MISPILPLLLFDLPPPRGEDVPLDPQSVAGGFLLSLRIAH
jgi:hypothetical protein